MQNCYANWPLILEFLKVFLSWPVAALVLGGIFMRVFREPIRELVSRLTKFKAIGAEIEASAPVPSNQEQAKPAAELSDPVDQAAATPARAREVILALRDVCMFEQTYNLIFGSQMQLLHYLRMQGAQGAEKAPIEAFYQEHLKLVGEGQPPTLEDYLRFLAVRTLIEPVDGTERVRISALGDKFVGYIVSTYTPPPFRPF
ncbi:hypothetical protein [Variovorax sp. 350MFTsu5.1]|uniref:hypothetical protein n=1 Tax=Variovorax sp. 350MFTsu5.1 TaxID=3158365 RepID=UPI003AB000F1